MDEHRAGNDTVQESGAVKAVVKTLRILEVLSAGDNRGVTKIAAETGMSKATAFRFLLTLEREGYVRQDRDNGTYSLTLQLFEVASLVRQRRTRLDDIHPVLQVLAESTGETVHLATMEQDHLVYLDKVESKRALKVSMASRVGRVAPLHCTAMGKVLLAYQDPVIREDLLPRLALQRFTPTTITSIVALKRALVEIEQNGIALDEEEHEEGVYCIAAPIQNSRGDVSAAVSISMPSVRITRETNTSYQQMIRETAARISAMIGAGGWSD
jgi:IclR family KDG regulon transcriptional repressor